jgi:hypothetical protein
MQISVQVNRTAAAELHGEQTSNPDVSELRRRLDELGLRLAPMHPGETDPQLATYFMVDVHNDTELTRALEFLQESPVVEAAYVKPPEEPAHG